MERFNLQKLSVVEVREQYQIKIPKRFGALEILNDSNDTNTDWENIKESIKISAKESLGQYEWKQRNPWFDEECSQFVDQRKQAKLCN
jgi:hypothetical protein